MSFLGDLGGWLKSGLNDVEGAVGIKTTPPPTPVAHQATISLPPATQISPPALKVQAPTPIRLTPFKLPTKTTGQPIRVTRNIMRLASIVGGNSLNKGTLMGTGNPQKEMMLPTKSKLSNPQPVGRPPLANHPNVHAIKAQANISTSSSALKHSMASIKINSGSAPAAPKVQIPKAPTLRVAPIKSASINAPTTSINYSMPNAMGVYNVLKSKKAFSSMPTASQVYYIDQGVKDKMLSGKRMGPVVQRILAKPAIQPQYSTLEGVVPGLVNEGKTLFHDVTNSPAVHTIENLGNLIGGNPGPLENSWDSFVHQMLRKAPPLLIKNKNGTFSLTPVGQQVRQEVTQLAQGAGDSIPTEDPLALSGSLPSSSGEVVSPELATNPDTQAIIDHALSLPPQEYSNQYSPPGEPLSFKAAKAEQDLLREQYGTAGIPFPTKHMIVDSNGNTSNWATGDLNNPTLTDSKGNPVTFSEFNKMLGGSSDEKVPTSKIVKMRNPMAEQGALDVLKNGGTRDEAIQHYKELSGETLKQSRWAVSQAARDAEVALRPNVRTPNPEGDIHDLPSAQPGDYQQATINRSRVIQTVIKLNNDFQSALDKLSPTDRADFQDYVEGTKNIEEAQNPQLVQNAVNASQRFTDTVNAMDHSLKGTTPHIKNYFPETILRDTPEQIAKDELQAAQDVEESYTPDQWRKFSAEEKQQLIQAHLAEFELTPLVDGANFTFKGVRNQPRTFANRQELLAAGQQQMYPDPGDAMNAYSQQVEKVLGDRAFQKAALEADKSMRETPGTAFKDVRYGPGENDTVKLSEKAAKAFKNSNLNQADASLPIRIGRNIKQSLVLASGVHGAIIPQRWLFAVARLAGDNLLQSFFERPSLDTLENWQPTTTVEETGAQIGSPLSRETTSRNPVTNLVFHKFLPAMHSLLLTLVKTYMENHGIDPNSVEARDLGSQINHVMGYADTKMSEGVLFAPSLVKSTAEMYAGAFKPSGFIDRSGVIGEQAIAQFAAFATSAASAYIVADLEHHPNKVPHNDFWSTVIQGLYGNYATPFFNSKGQQIDISTPGNYQDVPLKILTSVTRGKDGQLHIGWNPNPLSSVAFEAKSLANPLINMGIEGVTGKNYMGQQIVDPHASIPTQAEQLGLNLASSALPINVQAGVDEFLGKHLPGSLQKAVSYNTNRGPLGLLMGGSTVGLNAHADLTTGMGPSTTAYYNKRTPLVNAGYEGNWNVIEPGLAQKLRDTGINNSNAAQYQTTFNQQLNNVFPATSTVNAQGVKIPTPYSSHTATEALSNFTYTDPRGNQQLSPVFTIEQKLSNATPGYPTPPLYRLKGEGVLLGQNGGSRSAPKALIALQYQADTEMDSGDAPGLLKANGGQNGWLAGYLNTKVAYDAAYKKNMTTYLSKMNLTPTDITQYWQDHPSSPLPFTYPVFSKPTLALQTQYYNLVGSNPTAASQFFKQHSAVLQNVMTQTAIYTKHRSIAATGSAPQPFPSATPHVTSILNSLPTGTTALDKQYIAQVIKANPDVNQYLGQVSLYETSKILGVNAYINPAQPNSSEGDLLNQGASGQKAMKDMVNTSKHDIGTNSSLVGGTATQLASGNPNSGSKITLGKTTFTSPIPNATNLIVQYAKKYNVDPLAALSVSAMEGLSGNVGDNGTSFGPFQLHAGGALPASVWAQGPAYAQTWANSPAGIEYAIKTMAEKAQGLTGQQAVNAIVNGFEHPLHVQNEINGAMEYYTGNKNYTSPPITNGGIGYEFAGAGGNIGGFTPGYFATGTLPRRTYFGYHKHNLYAVKPYDKKKFTVEKGKAGVAIHKPKVTPVKIEKQASKKIKGVVNHPKSYNKPFTIGHVKNISGVKFMPR